MGAEPLYLRRSAATAIIAALTGAPGAWHVLDVNENPYSVATVVRLGCGLSIGSTQVVRIEIEVEPDPEPEQLGHRSVGAATGSTVVTGDGNTVGEAGP